MRLQELAPLRQAPPDEALTASVERLGPRVLEGLPEESFGNVNTPEELAEMAQRIARGS